MHPKPVLKPPPGPGLQSTLAREVTLCGVGLHTGVAVNMRLGPAPEGSGIRFIRTDVEGCPVLEVNPRSLTGGIRGTNLTVGTTTVHTIEHVMAACAGLGVDNVEIRLDGPEPPVVDGSAQPFVDAMLEAGLVEQSALRRITRVLRPVTIGDDRGQITALPHSGFKITYTLQYPNPMIGCQLGEFEITSETLRHQILRARTFCLRREVDDLRQANLALGGSLENAIVVDDDRILNEGPLRFPDEFVRHKVLDLVGDLSTLGGRIEGHFVAVRTGHRHNISLIKALLEKSAVVTVTDAKTRYDIEEIRQILPHRYPFLLIDRITELVSGISAVGLKNVTSNEHFFSGHFPGRMVMPGVLILEAMAQVAGVCILSLPEHRGKTPYFTGMDEVHFRSPIVPGDQVRIEVRVERVRGAMGRLRGEARVDGKVAAEGVLKFTLMA